ncbi:tetrahydrofolylpolyglutamate synthase [Xylariomycetidae sp. FL2044]|nr:tetrahydrofolylpolyglutamate synthase [Xylariomycetidae sp. FL2044]
MHHVFRRNIRIHQPFPSPKRTLSPCSSWRTMASQSARTYNDAIDALNSLQTPYAIFEARRKAGIRPDASFMAEMNVYLRRIGYAPSDLDRLNILHVAGTKGKGSTCAFAASILAHHRKSHGAPPRRIGLFTSPHLIAVRERIRIDGDPIAEDVFARYFFDIWDRLGRAEAAEGSPVVDPRLGLPMPPRPIYARYLTLMSYHVFLREGVDVAIYETGIGGEYDATNIVPRPVASAISTLGVDHVFALGDTVEKIAWHKAGIMKPGCVAFTVEQVPAAARVLEDRAREKAVDLQVLPVDPRLRGVNVRPDALFQKKNATLGIALAEAALRRLDPNFKPDSSSSLPRDFVDGIEQVVWRGRCEVKTQGNIRWHVDGAHTADSLKMAARWYAGECAGRKGPRALVFNQQGRDEAVHFLAGLQAAALGSGDHHYGGRTSAFDHVVFCTNVTYAATGYKRDFVNHQYDPDAVKALTAQRAFAKRWAELDPGATVVVLPTIEDALNYVRELERKMPDDGAVTGDGNGDGNGEGDRDMVLALVTGSLHLVGGALGILEDTDAL